MNSPTKYSLTTATAIVVASMIGTGVFTSLYFQVEAVPSGSALMVLWLAGGIVALSGGLCYAELAGLFPRSGGEYEYLSKIYHPALGFSAGLCSLVVGFAAPMAGIALNFGNYLSPIMGTTQDSDASKIAAIVSVIFVVLIHLISPIIGNKFQNISTIFKVLLIAFFVLLPFIQNDKKMSQNLFLIDNQIVNHVFSGGFFACLALLYYTYTGWNTSVYMASDIKNPKRNLPLSILIGVALVTVIYLCLNFAFLYVCDLAEITAGGPSIGNTFIAKIFGVSTWLGVRVVDIFSALLSFTLLASINAFMIASYRVAEVLGGDYAIFKTFTKKNQHESPYWAVVVVGIITIVFVVASDIKSLLDYIGFALSIFGSLAVLGVIIMRFRSPDAIRTFKTWGYPITPLVFLGINAAMIYYSIQNLYGGNFLYETTSDGQFVLSPLTASVITILLGIALYFVVNRNLSKRS
jgi:basic amino acid/polyamine antiporter, APA family